MKELEVRLRHKSGEYRWYLDRGKVVARDIDGNLRMVGTIADITERKQAERELAEALSNLQTIMETVPDVIFVLDLEGRLSKWNRRLETVTGIRMTSCWEKSALEMVPTSETEPTSAAIQQAFGDRLCGVEGHLLTKDGRAILYHWNGAPSRIYTAGWSGLPGLVGTSPTESRPKPCSGPVRSGSVWSLRLPTTSCGIGICSRGGHWWSPNACDKFGYDPRTETSIDAWE